MADPVSLGIAALTYASAEYVGAAAIAAVIGAEVVVPAYIATAVGVGAITTGVGALRGQDPDIVLKNAIINGAAAGGGAYVGNLVAVEVGGATGSAAAATISKSVANNVTVATIRGTDVEKAAISGLAAGAVASLNQLDSFKELPPSVKQVISNTTAAALTGGDVKTAAVAGVIQSIDILGTAINSSPTLKEAFSNPDNKGFVTIAQNAVTYGMSAALQGKDVDAAVKQSLVTTSSKLLGDTMSGSLKQYVADAKDSYNRANLAATKYDETSKKQAEEYKTYNEFAQTVNESSATLDKMEDAYDLEKRANYDSAMQSRNAAVNNLTQYGNSLNQYKAQYDENVTSYKRGVDWYNGEVVKVNSGVYKGVTVDGTKPYAVWLQEDKDKWLPIREQRVKDSLDSYNNAYKTLEPSILENQKNLAAADDKLEISAGKLNDLRETYDIKSDEVQAYIDANKAKAEQAKTTGDSYTNILNTYQATLDAESKNLTQATNKIQQVETDLQNETIAAANRSLTADQYLDTWGKDLPDSVKADIMSKSATDPSFDFTTATVEATNTMKLQAMQQAEELRKANAESTVNAIKTAIPGAADIDSTKLVNAYVADKTITQQDLATDVKSEVFNTVATPEEKKAAETAYLELKSAYPDAPTDQIRLFAQQQELASKLGAPTIDLEDYTQRAYDARMAYDNARAEGLGVDVAAAMRDNILNSRIEDYNSSNSSAMIFDQINNAKSAIQAMLNYDSGTEVAGVDSGTKTDAGGAGDVNAKLAEQKAAAVALLSEAAKVPGSGIYLDKEGIYNIDDPENFRSIKFSSDGTMLGQSILITPSNSMTPLFAKDFLETIFDKTPGEGLDEEGKYTYSKSVSQEANDEAKREALDFLKNNTENIPASVIDDIMQKVLSGEYTPSQAYKQYAAANGQGIDDKLETDEGKTLYDYALDQLAERTDLSEEDKAAIARQVVGGDSVTRAVEKLNDAENWENNTEALAKSLGLSDEDVSELKETIREQILTGHSPVDINNQIRNVATARSFGDKSSATDLYLNYIGEDEGIQYRYEQQAETGTTPSGVQDETGTGTTPSVTEPTIPSGTGTTPTGSGTTTTGGTGSEAVGTEPNTTTTSTGADTSAGSGEGQTSPTVTTPIVTPPTTTPTEPESVVTPTVTPPTTDLGEIEIVDEKPTYPEIPELLPTGETPVTPPVTPPVTTPTTPTVPKLPTIPSTPATTSPSTPTTTGGTTETTPAWKAPSFFSTGLSSANVPEVKFQDIYKPTTVDLDNGSAITPASTNMNQPPAAPQSSYYNYGVEKSPFELAASPFTVASTPVAGLSAVPGFMEGGMASPLMAASGGDVPHKGSHYVQGDGGGQDDLIDARLADGEYVFDADVVAALGDGSNKRGAEILDKFREKIRSHKRSAPLNAIPPKAKSPLAYLKGIK